MTFSELKARLLAEHYRPDAFSIGDDWGRCDDVECLAKVGDHYEIFYVERGRRVDSPTAVYPTEEQACAGYYALMSKNVTARTHFLGHFESQTVADGLVRLLAENGIRATQDHIPWGGPGRFRYRVYVLGQDHVLGRQLAASYSKNEP